MTWLARREYGRGELTARLIERGCREVVAAEVVEQLAAEGAVSDERFVEAVVHARRARGFGPLYIRRELEEKRVARELIGRWVEPRNPEWLEDLQRVRKKKYGGRMPSSLAERARQTRFFQSRGYTHDQIRAVLGSDDE